MEKLVELGQSEGFSDELMEQLLKIAQVRKVKAKTIFIDYGQYVDTIYVVLSGGFIMKTWDEEKGVHRAVNFFLASFQPFMTEMVAYSLGEKTLNRFDALSDSEVVEFKKEELDQLASQYNELEKFKSQMVLNGLISENKFRIKLLTYSSEKLYKHIITDFPEIIKHVPSKHIASFLGISDVWLSNIKRKT